MTGSDGHSGPTVLFQLTVTSDGQLHIQFPVGSDELAMRGWLDKVMESAHEWIKHQTTASRTIVPASGPVRYVELSAGTSAIPPRGGAGYFPRGGAS